MIRVMMGANALTIRNLYGHDCLVSNGVYMQCVRWKRKPIWLPTAKTKVFRVPVKPQIPRDEFLEIQRLYNNYRTAMKSLRYHFHSSELYKTKTTAIKDKELEDDFMQCYAINEEWNKEVDYDRNIRLKKRMENLKADLTRRIQEREEQERLKQLEADEIVKKAKAEAPTFITEKNIDAAIASVLASTVNHNVAITLEGKPYEGTVPIHKLTQKDNVEPDSDIQ